MARSGRSARSSTMAALAAVALPLCLGIALFAALSVTETAGVSVLRCGAGGEHVLAPVGGRVFVMDRFGLTKVVLDGPDGAGLHDVSDVDALPVELDGGFVVSNGGVLEFYTADGTHERSLSLRDVVALAFEVEPLWDGGFLVADTEGHRILRIDADGAPVGEALECGYANGIGRWTDTTFMAVCTYTSEVAVFDADLNPVSVAGGSALDHPLMGRIGGNAFDVVRGPGAVLHRDECRTPTEGCGVMRLTATSSERQWVASLAKAELRTTEWTRQLREQVGFCVTASGSVVVGSGRYGRVVEFRDEEGGGPGVFEETPTVTEASLGGAEVAPGVWTEEFGDGVFEAATGAVWNSRRTLELAETWATYGIYAVLFGLLLLLWLERGSDSGWSERLQRIVDELVKPDLVNLAMYALRLGGVLIVGAALGWLLLGAAGALGLGLLAAVTLGRRVAGPPLMDARDEVVAVEAFELFVGDPQHGAFPLTAGETVEAAAFVLPAGDTEEVLETFAEEAIDLPDDALSVLEGFVPPFHIVAVTTLRVFVYRCGILGGPKGPIRMYARLDMGGTRPSAGTATIRVKRGLVGLTGAGGAFGQAFELPEWFVTPDPLRTGLPVSTPAAACSQCSERVSDRSRCDHLGTSQRAMLLGALLPGLGHLSLGAYGRARVMFLLLATTGLQLASVLLFNHFGTLPITSGTIVTSAFALVVFWLVSLADVAWIVRGRQHALDGCVELRGHG